MSSRVPWKIIILFSFIILLYVAFNRQSYAGFAEDYQGFLKTYDAYRGAHQNYITTRNQYLQYGTLNAQNEALQAVKNYLVARDEVLLSYISLLRLKNADTTLATLLTDEERFLQSHREKVPAVGTLNDSVNVSQEVESRHIPFQITSRKVVATVLISKVEDLRHRYLNLEAKAKQLIETLKSQGKDTTTLDRWLLDAHNKELLVEQKLFEARNKTSTLQGSSVENLTKEYNTIQSTIFEANQYLREALAYITELKENIKYGDF